MPTFSVVIPTYGRTTELVTAIESVLSQTSQDYEIVVIDDNSEKKETRLEVAKIEKKYQNHPQIKFYYNKSNLGGGGTRNVGINRATGEYIAFLDDDDIFLENKLAVMSSAINKHPEYSIFYGRQKNDRGFVTQMNRSGNLLLELCLSDCIAATTQLVIKRAALLQVGCFDIVPAKQETILQFKLFLQGEKAYFVDEVLTYVEDGERERISGRQGKSLVGELNFRNVYRANKEVFTKENQRKVETAFSSRLIKEYYKRKQILAFFKEFSTMCWNSPKDTLGFISFMVKKKLNGSESELWNL